MSGEQNFTPEEVTAMDNDAKAHLTKKESEASEQRAELFEDYLQTCDTNIEEAGAGYYEKALELKAVKEILDAELKKGDRSQILHPVDIGAISNSFIAQRERDLKFLQERQAGLKPVTTEDIVQSGVDLVQRDIAQLRSGEYSPLLRWEKMILRGEIDGAHLYNPEYADIHFTGNKGSHDKEQLSKASRYMRERAADTLNIIRTIENKNPETQQSVA